MCMAQLAHLCLRPLSASCLVEQVFGHAILYVEAWHGMQDWSWYSNDWK